MKLESQVCNLELSNKLKELGVPQDSVFAWVRLVVEPYPAGTDRSRDEAGNTVVTTWFTRKEPSRRTGNLREDFVAAAFTAGEMGEMLPMLYKSWLVGPSEWWCSNQQSGHHEEAGTEADARARMLIYLIENGLLPK